jgi:cation:H+ antiporter
MIATLHIVVGLILLFGGGEALVRSAVSIARHAGLSPFLIGLTIIAYGTSAPEMVVSVQSVLEGHPNIAIGNIIGTNIADIFLVLGLAALIYPVALDKKLCALNSVFLVLVTILFYLFCYLGLMNWVVGSLLLGTLFINTYISFSAGSKRKKLVSKEQKEEIEEEIEEDLYNIKLNVWQAILLCALGILILSFGANIVIKGAIELSEMFGLSEATIGLTVIAFGTVMPELCTSVVAAYHKRSQIVLGNIIGGNLFNILGIMGATSIVRPLVIPPRILAFDLPILIIAVAMLSIFIYFLPRISRRIGIMLIGIYIIYIIMRLNILS